MIAVTSFFNDAHNLNFMGWESLLIFDALLYCNTTNIWARGVKRVYNEIFVRFIFPGSYLGLRSYGIEEEAPDHCLSCQKLKNSGIIHTLGRDY